MKKAILLFAVLATTASGLALAKSKADWTLKGAVRSEAMVTLSLLSKEPELSPEQRQSAEATATQQCSKWGLGSAELNGEIQRVCSGRSRFGKCKRWEFTMPLQCSAPGSAN